MEIRLRKKPMYLAGFLIAFLTFSINLANCNGYDGIENRNHFRPYRPTTPLLRLCDASRESTEECSDQLGQAKRPKFLLFKKNNVTGKGEYIRLSPNDATAIQRDADPYKGAVWKILIHGFLNNAQTSFPVNVRDAYMEKMRRTNERVKYNILVVDWGELACASVSGVKDYLYDYDAENTAAVGRYLAEFIVFLHNNKFMDLTTDAHIIGHSLGSHVAGHAGRNVLDMTGKTVRRITGLDPAGPSFWAWRYLPSWVLPERRLHRGDTQFLDVYHTSQFFGSYEQMGDIDFSVNGGKSQPSCVPRPLSWFTSTDVTQACSHNYATFLYAKTINDNSMHGCMCPSARSYEWGSCRCVKKAVFGEFVDNSTVTIGNFYVTTPRDDSDVALLNSFKNFTVSGFINELKSMVCDDWIPGDD